MRNGATAGFKYFDLNESKKLRVTVRGSSGIMKLLTAGGRLFALFYLDKSKQWKTYTSELVDTFGTGTLRFTYVGEGKIDFLSFSLL